MITQSWFEYRQFGDLSGQSMAPTILISIPADLHSKDAGGYNPLPQINRTGYAYDPWGSSSVTCLGTDRIGGLVPGIIDVSGRSYEVARIQSHSFRTHSVTRAGAGSPDNAYVAREQRVDRLDFVGSFRLLSDATRPNIDFVKEPHPLTTGTAPFGV